MNITQSNQTKALLSQRAINPFSESSIAKSNFFKNTQKSSFANHGNLCIPQVRNRHIINYKRNFNEKIVNNGFEINYKNIEENSEYLKTYIQAFFLKSKISCFDNKNISKLNTLQFVQDQQASKVSVKADNISQVNFTMERKSADVQKLISRALDLVETSYISTLNRTSLSCSLLRSSSFSSPTLMRQRMNQNSRSSCVCGRSSDSNSFYGICGSECSLYHSAQSNLSLVELNAESQINS